MGMYDDFAYDECVCPYCDGVLKNGSGQTKQFECLLTYYKIGDIVQDGLSTEFSMSEICPYCRQYFEMIGVIKDGKYTGMKKGSEYGDQKGIDKRNAKFFAANREEFMKKYPNKWLIIYDGRLVAFGDDLSRTSKVVLAKYPDAEKTWIRERLWVL